MKRILLIAAMALLPLMFSCKKTDPLFKANNHPIVKPEAVDLGIKVDGKTIYWGSFNLGATQEAEYGNYYSWGTTETSKDGYTWEAYPYANAVGTEFTKYCLTGMEDWWGASRSVDDKSTLVSTDDAAKKNLKGHWRMPTIDEVLALLYTQKLTSDYKWELEDYGADENGADLKNVYGNPIVGIRITWKKTGASIFLPAGGRIDGKTPEEVNALGYYWTSSLSKGDLDGPDGAYCLGFEVGDAAGRWTIGRYYGALIRPVYVDEE